MTQTKWIVRLAALVAMTAACTSSKSESDGNLTMQGTVSQDLYGSDVQAVALGKDGRTFWSSLDAKGDFKLSVPTGQSYRIVLVRPAAGGGNTLLADVTTNGALGRTHWLKGDAAAVVRLGTILPAEAYAANATGAGVKTASLRLAASGSGRGGTGASSDSSSTDEAASGGRGGSGRGGHEGYDEDDGEDDYADDSAHSDDPDCREGERHDGEGEHLCKTEKSLEAVCTRGAEHADYEMHDDAAIGDCGATEESAPTDSSPETAPEADAVTPISP